MEVVHFNMIQRCASNFQKLDLKASPSFEVDQTFKATALT